MGVAMIATKGSISKGTENADDVANCRLETRHGAVTRRAGYRYRDVLLVLALLLAPAVAHAVPAAPRIHELLQPDGTRFEARQWGDEWRHGWETADGYSIVVDAKSGFWTFARRAESGPLVATELRVGHEAPPADLPRHLRPRGGSARRDDQLRARSATTGLVARAQATTGTANVPVILANFNDTSTTYDAAGFTSLLFGTGSWSMKDYYEEVSYGAFSVAAGPGGVVGWYTASNNHDYYGTNVSGEDQWPGDLVHDAVAAADAAGYNFAPYDRDGDCFVDTVVVVHQGRGEDESGTATDIWSHNWDLYSAQYFGKSHYGIYTTNDACLAGGFIMVNDYTMQPERSIDGIVTVGVFAHEYGHALGLPDLYDTDYSSRGVGRWSVMASGSWCGVTRNGDRPSHMDPWSKYRLGWVTPTLVTSTLTNETINRASTTADVYQFRAGSPTDGGEYFLLENRQQHSFDEGLPGAGLLIWHVDEAKTHNDSECYQGGPDCASQHYKVAVEQADGLWDLEKNADNGDSGDPFPGSASTTNFTSVTTPSSALYDGTASGVIVTEIGASAETMTATLAFDSSGGVTQTVTVFSDDFEAGLGDWRIDADSTTWGLSTYRANGGSQSAWCAAGGSTPQPPGGPYAPDMAASMIYGPFSLADATAAWMEFDTWYETESGYDEVWWGLSVDDVNYYGYPYSGTSPWSRRTFDFDEIVAVTAVGQPQVWVIFHFSSDDIIELEGAYIDNVAIKKKVPIPGGCDLVLENQTVSTAVIYESCDTIAAGLSFDVAAPGDLTLRAATQVTLRNGFSVGLGARLTVALDPSLAGT
jgi:M6 family metalloprotease-like protein